MLTKGDGVENNQTWKLRSMLWCSIVVTIRLSPEPLSILASLKTILDEMDAHYDSIACVLARFRSQSNPSDQLLDGMMVWVDNIWVFQWIFLQCRSWISYSLVDLTSSFGFQINNPLRLLQDVTKHLEKAEVLLLALTLPFSKILLWSLVFVLVCSKLEC